VERHFPVAPWPRRLKIVSALATLLLAWAGIAAYRAIPVPTGFTHGFGFAVALVFPAILFFSALFIVSGYAVDGTDLFIARPFWSTRIPLSGLRRVFADPAACRGSVRVFGNGGLYSFTGLYRNAALGRYRLFATDLSRAVVLVLPKRTIVVTPESPEAFVRGIRLVFPSADVTAPEFSVHSASSSDRGTTHREPQAE